MTLLVFAGDHYYPSGGAEDYVMAAPTVDEAVAAFVALLEGGESYQWMHIFDPAAVEVVEAWTYEGESYDTHFVTPPVKDERFPSHTMHIAGYANPKTLSWWTHPVADA